MNASRIEIDTKQFITNLQAIRNKVSKVKICLPLKANAYGHGILQMAQVAIPYVDYLAVAFVEEGQLLRDNGITIPVLVFGAFGSEDVPGLVDNKLEITISSIFKAKQIADYCRQIGKKAKVHIKVDTGMNRIGVRVETAPELLKYVLSLSELELVGVYSHLATADEDDNSFTLEQINKFRQIANLAKSLKPNVVCHLANSAGVCYYRDSYFDMVRPGIMSYGYFPRALDVGNKELLSQIKPCFSLKSRVIYTKIVEKNQGISYNHKYITKNRTRVVTIPIGYGDGYPRILSNVGEVILRGHKYTISGTICMDMLMVDIGENGVSYVDDEVILIGKQGCSEITIGSVADKCGTIIYEILCGFINRIPRVYL